ncbi:MAG: TolC family protein [Parvibaculales bacterium]
MFGLVVSRPKVRVRWFCRRYICGISGAAISVAAIMSLALLVPVARAHAAEEDDGALIAERQIFNSDIFTPGALDDELYNPTIPKPDMQPGQTLLDDEAIEQAPLVPAPPAVAELQQTLLDHPSLLSAGQQVCEAKYQVLFGQSNYYPKLSMNLSGGSKWVNKTTRADEFGGTDSPEYDGDGVNAVLSMRQNIYDWGLTRATINVAQHDRAVAQLQRLLTLEEKLGEFYGMAFQYVLQEELVRHFRQAKQDVDFGIAGVEARFRAGAARLAEVRQAKIIGLDITSQVTQAERELDIVLRAMKTQFALDAAHARRAVAHFIRMRPEIPELIGGRDSLNARILQRNILRTQAEQRQVKAERRPGLTGVIAGRAWDVFEKNTCGDVVPRNHPDAVNRGSLFSPDYRRGKNCSTRELTGAIEFNMPLFDGGASKARLGGAAARERGLEAELAAHLRQHESESRRLQGQLLSLLTRLAEAREKEREIKTQLNSEQQVEGRTRANAIDILALKQRLVLAQADLIGLRMQAENARRESLSIADRLADTVKITLGESGC